MYFAFYFFIGKGRARKGSFFYVNYSMFEGIIKKLKSVDLEKISLNEFSNVKEEAFDLNTEDQLFSKGVDSNGNSLGAYAPLSVKLRGEAGLPTDRITLKITGDFYDGWEANFSKFPVEFTSRDEKTGEILFQFGNEIFGLTKDNIKNLLDEGLKERIQDSFKKSVSIAIKEV